MRVGPLLGVACGALALAACVLKADGFDDGHQASTTDSGVESGVTPELEASTPVEEAGPAPEAGSGSDAGADGGLGLVNVLANGDFEQGCASWKPPDDPSTVTMTTSTDAHSGAKACRVCLNAPSNTYVYQTVSMNLSAGQRTFGQIFVRGAQANPPGANLQFFLSYTDVQSNDDSSPSSFAQPSASSWLRMSMIQELYEDANRITIVLVFDGNQNKCVLLDDASLAIVPDP